MARTYQIRESLLDSVDADEVEDSEDVIEEESRPSIPMEFTVTVNYGWITEYVQPNILLFQITGVLRSSPFTCDVDVSKFDDFDEKTKKRILVRFSLYSDTPFERFCDLLVRMVMQRDGFQTTMKDYKVVVSFGDPDAYIPSDSGRILITNTFDNRKDCECKKFSVHGWFEFASQLFPKLGLTRKGAQGAIAGAYARFQTEDCTCIANVDGDKWAYLSGSGLLTGFDFTACRKFCDGFALVKRLDWDGDKYMDGYNYVGADGKVLLDEWQDYASDFGDGLAVVGTAANGKASMRVIDRNGKTVSNTNYLPEGGFHEGFAVVRYGKNVNKFNYIGRDGRLLSDSWFDSCGDFSEGMAVVSMDKPENRFNYMRTDGTMLLDDGCDWCGGPFSCGYGVVRRDMMYHYVDRNGKMLGKDRFSVARRFSEGLAVVSDTDYTFPNPSYNFIDTSGRKIFDRTVNGKRVTITDAYPFSGGLARVCVSLGYIKRWNYMKPDGKMLSDRFFMYCEPFVNGIARVEMAVENTPVKFYNFINTRGELLIPEDDSFCVKARYCMSEDGCLLSEYGYGSAMDPDGEFVAFI